MPFVYTYRCCNRNCRHLFFLRRPYDSRNDPHDCPECAFPATRVYTAPALNTFKCSEQYAADKNFEGRDEAERKATRRRDNEAYAASYGQSYKEMFG